MKKLIPEEAAEVLEDMKVKIEIPKAAVTQWKRNTALDMAIEALKYSEVQNSSDVVSRQNSKNAICNACGKIDCAEMDTCKKLDIPSEESKALGWQYRTYIPHNKYCPKCGKDSPYNKRWNFCPNCGGDMRENEVNHG